MIFQNIKLLFNHKIGLVLSGGGAKGAYQIGVFHSLKELGISSLVKVISGTSIGALNSVLFLTDNQETWLETWKDANFKNFLSSRQYKNTGKRTLADISEFLKTPIEKIINDWEHSSDIEEFVLKQDINFFSQNGFIRVLKKHIDLEIIASSPINTYACAYNIDTYQPEYFNLKEASRKDRLRILLASACIPFMYKPVVINNRKYLDGGIYIPLYKSDNVVNTPVKPAFDENCDIIIVVYHDHIDKVDYSAYQEQMEDTIILEIYPSQPLEEIKGTGSLDFSRGSMTDRMELGYHDAMFTIAPMLLKLLQGQSIASLIEKQNLYNENLRKKFSG